MPTRCNLFDHAIPGGALGYSARGSCSSGAFSDAPKRPCLNDGAFLILDLVKTKLVIQHKYGLMRNKLFFPHPTERPRMTKYSYPQNWILVVGDQDPVRKTVRGFLEGRRYYNLAEAKDGETALEMLESGKFSHVITDNAMPKLTGLGLLERIKKSDKLKHLPVVLITDEAIKAEVLAAMALGVQGIIVKPFTIGKLEAKILPILDVK